MTEMVRIYFGERWDAPMLDGATEVPVPVGQSCLLCEELIQEGDRGTVRPALRGSGEAIPAPVHLECELLGLFGRFYGVDIPVGGDVREAGMYLILKINYERAQQGKSPL